jgi:hypothetical protein
MNMSEGYFEITLILAVVAGAVIVPFTVGLVKGPPAEPGPVDFRGARSLKPLSRVATVYGRFLVLYVIGAVATISYRSGNFPVVCASTSYDPVGGGGSGIVVKSGVTAESSGPVQACTGHPTAAQWFFYALIRLPNLILWALALMLIWQLIRQAARSGPFTRQSATIMWRLGLLIVAGTVVAAAVSALGTGLLASTLLAPPRNGVAVANLLFDPLRALVPWPALGGAALLSFARMTGAAAELDEEVKATV